jgi:programmed cell death 8 (apoptosis-inducing factor)
MDVESQVLILESGRRVKYARCLIASGGRPKQLDLFQTVPAAIRDQYLTTFRTVEDFKRLEQMVRAGKDILIVGGGFLGSELACSVAYHGQKFASDSQQQQQQQPRVTQLFPEDGNMALVFPRYLFKWTTAKIRKCTIQKIIIVS